MRVGPLISRRGSLGSTSAPTEPRIGGLLTAGRHGSIDYKCRGHERYKLTRSRPLCEQHKRWTRESAREYHTLHTKGGSVAS